MGSEAMCLEYGVNDAGLGSGREPAHAFHKLVKMALKCPSESNPLSGDKDIFDGS